MLVVGTLGAVTLIVLLASQGDRIASGLGLWRHGSVPPLASVVSTSAPAQIGSSAGQVEVPDLSGMSLTQAKVLAAAAGLAVEVDVDDSLTPAAQPQVRAQRPVARSIVDAGGTIQVTVPRSAAIQASAPRRARAKGQCVVVIDPGYQSTADVSAEPIGPGSNITVPRGTTGEIGTRSGVPEYELDRQLAVELQDSLTAAGVRVIMTRTTDDVDLSDSQRGAVAAAAGADLFVRVALQSSSESSAAGVVTEYPASNQWTKSMVAPSRRAASAIQRCVVRSTNAEDLGTEQRLDVPVFNWSNTPSVLLEAGFLSNPVEDRLLTSTRYQRLLSQGVADGIVDYLNSGR